MARLRPGSAGLFPMRVVAELTGVPAATIRAWQRRYGAVAPGRTAGNARRFSAADVERLQRLRRAVERGHAIGTIARLGNDELRALAATTPIPASVSGPGASAGGDEYVAVRERYLAALVRFDLHRAREQLALAAATMRAYDFVFQVALPLLRRIGEMWERGALTVAHEHAATVQLKSMLLALMRLPSPRPGAPRLLATTPPGNPHELGALAAAFLAALRGLDATFLGPATPADDLEAAVTLGRTDILLLSIVGPASDDGAREVARLARRLSALVEVWVGIASDHPARRLLEGVRAFDRFEDYDAALAMRLA